VYSVIRKHDGYIHADSKSGVRTTIYVYLPAKKQGGSNDRLTESGKKEGRTMSAKARILVMDDEEIIRDVAEQMLEQLGYDVISAKDGAEAIEIYKRELDNNARIDVVILDLSVRDGMDGNEAMLDLLKIDPDIRAIVSSGYSNNPEMLEYRKYGFKNFVDKPYTLRDLSRVLEEVLGVR
jgi:CheY-like chemotaxis protein